MHHCIKTPFTDIVTATGGCGLESADPSHAGKIQLETGGEMRAVCTVEVACCSIGIYFSLHGKTYSESEEAAQIETSAKLKSLFDAVLTIGECTQKNARGQLKLPILMHSLQSSQAYNKNDILQ